MISCLKYNVSIFFLQKTTNKYIRKEVAILCRQSISLLSLLSQSAFTVTLLAPFPLVVSVYHFSFSGNVAVKFRGIALSFCITFKLVCTVNVHTYIVHTYIRAYVHTYMHTYICTYIHTYIQYTPKKFM